MGLDGANRETLIGKYWQRCEETLSDADFNISVSRWRTAANRLYYSAFYAVCALFVKDGYPIRSHRGAKAVLGEKYVLTGKISVEISSIFNKLETLRDKADYDIVFEATEKDISLFRPKVQLFIETVKQLVF